MHVLMHTCVHTQTYTFWLLMPQFTNALLLLSPKRCLSEQVIFPIFRQFLFPIYMGKSTQTRICRTVRYEIRLMIFPYVLHSSPQYFRLPPYCVTGCSDGVSTAVLALLALTLPALQKLSANPMIAF